EGALGLSLVECGTGRGDSRIFLGRPAGKEGPHENERGDGKAESGGAARVQRGLSRKARPFLEIHPGVSSSLRYACRTDLRNRGGTWIGSAALSHRRDRRGCRGPHGCNLRFPARRRSAPVGADEGGGQEDPDQRGRKV